MEIKDVVKDHVLPFLPAKSLIRFRSVSKEWDGWIASPFLAHKQTYCFRDISGFFRQYGNGIPTFLTLNESAFGIPWPLLGFLPESTVVRSSCNGLLLCQGCDGEGVYYICNPVNKEWKELPRPNYYHGSEPAIVLAFEPSVLNIPAHYEVICAVPLIGQPLVSFEIYCSKEKSWRRSAAYCIELEFSELKEGGFYMKGTAYWDTSCGKVLAFDLKNELYSILPLPFGSAGSGVLTQMHGELCYICANNQTGNAYIIDIFGGIDMHLKHSIVLDFELVGAANGECRALPCVNSNVMMIVIGNTVYSYHVRDQKVIVVNREPNNFSARCDVPP
ncbi:hypothetical protein F0562_003786 [Nyssa sinensis]|uniref:F-box associated beta-propeller type 1 domain-containing protein n=1 Tax=Nyssa sinensis TaxID=561372 RepID=A0A5J5BZL1_9ASTE|nr:hypothetical protein F0562_003786 [Nyssa sinensis]